MWASRALALEEASDSVCYKIHHVLLLGVHANQLSLELPLKNLRRSLSVGPNFP